MRSALLGTFLYFACGQTNDEVGVIGLDFGFVGGFVARDFTATVAPMHKNITTLRVGNGTDGAKNTATGVGAITRENVYMQRAKTKGTMIARGVTERENLFATILANKTTIIFLKSFLFHVFSPSYDLYVLCYIYCCVSDEVFSTR
jgi:hypothetical protein